ncbi:MAG: protoporphyrinogen oxidase [Candidatus Cloacimonadota bacterium]|nr:MAG: protoporphyrinogen oxidase [Candidatus Cloacimonadota bacterium]
MFVGELINNMQSQEKYIETIIIGAGISGLCLSHHLKDHDYLIFESSDVVGGKITTQFSDGSLFEYGPNSLMLRSNDVKDLISELNLENDLVFAQKSSSARYLAKGTSLIKITPLNLITKILDFNFFYKILTLTYTKKTTDENETVFDFFQRKLGTAFTKYIITPFVSGIYAGDPHKLLIKGAFKKIFQLEKEYNSLIIGALSSKKQKKHKIDSGIASFKEGLIQICNTLYENSKNKILCNRKVQSITKVNDKYKITVNDKIYSCKNLILTIPAYNASSLLKGFLPETFIYSLDKINYPWLMVAQVLIPKTEIKLNNRGFGFLQIPDKNSKVLGCLFNSYMFPKKAKPGYELFTCFVGGSKSPGFKDIPTKQLQSEVIDYLAQVLKINNTKSIQITSMNWEQSIPQYDQNQNNFSQQLLKMTECQKNLYFCSNYVSGVSLPDCISNAKNMANLINS